MLAFSSVDAADHDLERRVRAFLLSSHLAALREVAIRADQGAITLRGAVPTYYCKQVAQERARRVPGVRRVINALHVVFESTPAERPTSEPTGRSSMNVARSRDVLRESSSELSPPAVQTALKAPALIFDSSRCA